MEKRIATKLPRKGTFWRTRAAVTGKQERVGVVIVDHGSKREASNAQLLQFVDLYKRTSGRTIVEPAHMEIAQPDIEQAFERCVAQGATRVVVGPYFLARGRHIQQDIPKLVKEAAEKFPGIQYRIADPIGTDPMLAEIIEAKVSAQLANMLEGETQEGVGP